MSQVETGQTIDWAAQKASLQPASIPTAAWNVIVGNLLTTIGGTTDSYNAALAQAATYLSGLGETTAQVSDVGRLWSFLVSQADAEFPSTVLTSTTDAALPTPGSLSLAVDRTFASSIASRYTPGIFGLGWTTSWQTSLSVDSAGNVTVNSGGALSYFPVQANGSFLDTDGEYGSLTLSAGIYTLTKASGTEEVFLPNDLLNYVQDTNGNRITLGYNGQNQLVAVTYSNPSDPSQPAEQLTLAYNAQGFVSQVADGTGNVWTYAYDAAGHLLSVTAPGPTAAGLMTSYAYDTGSNPETANALLSIANPGGSQQNFTYDALGRLSGTSANGGTEATAYAYLGQAEVQTTDAAGDKTITWYNDLGLPSRVQDPLGGISTYLYDSNGNPISYTDAAGNTYQYTYNSKGDLTKTINPLGQTAQMTYNSLSDLTSITDADNNTTQYGYSSAGNPLSITYPDGTQQSFTYDPLGNPSQTIEQNGDPIGYQYNAQGLVAQENFADGTYQIFAYDAHGNLLTAETFDAGGNLTGTTTLTYNAADELTSVSYPDGLSLAFTYNAQGQRTQSVDQSGYTTTYGYDALGRLSELTDGSGSTIVQYTYNPLGQLQEKLNGNDTYTTYAYDPDGNLTSEINYASDGAVNSSFTYAYNTLNEVTSMTDAAGNVTTYGYDATGKLTQVTSGGTIITYVDNADGSPKEVVDDGTPTSYTVNNDNEITQAGSTKYTYDANGNVTSMTDASGTTTYAYNDQNQLVSSTAPDGTVTTYDYSALGYLDGTASNGSQTTYLDDPSDSLGPEIASSAVNGTVNSPIGDEVAEYNNGSLAADYNSGLGLASQTGPSGTGYYDFDGGGNTVGITDPAGQYENQYNYPPSGEENVGQESLPNQFTTAGEAGEAKLGENPESAEPGEPGEPGESGEPAEQPGCFGTAANLEAGLGPTGDTACTVSGAIDAAMNCAGGAEGVASLENIEAGGKILGAASTAIDAITAINMLSGGGDNYDKVNAVGMLGADVVGTYVPGCWWVTPTAFVVNKGSKELGNWLVQDQMANADNVDKMGLVTLKRIRMLQNLMNLRSHDPNALIGPAGFGTQNFIQDAGSLPYAIDFENDGNAAAQDVTVTEQLDPNLNWSTFQLGSFGFGPVNVTVPAGLTQYQTTVSYQNSDGSSLDVQVALNFNVATGLLTVTFTSLDPLTGQAPTGVFDGFLPPDNSSGIGEGFVQYTVQPAAGLATGTTINQQASVVFDFNPPLATDPAFNTIDASPPSSSVLALPTTESATSFPVSWSGSDDTGGSGIASYTVYVSDDGGTPTVWQNATTATSAEFDGADGHTYAFTVTAVDNVGNQQLLPSPAVSTTVDTTPPTVSAPLVENGLTERSYVDQLTLEFNEPVTSTAAVPITLTEYNTLGNLVGSVPLTPGEFQWTTVPGTGASVLTWSLESFAGGTTSLPDGYYELTLPSSQITDQYGSPLNGGTDYTANFFVLQGDVNGDGVVDNNDMLAVDAVLGSRPGSSNWNPNADLNRNGTVTTSDRIVVYQNMGHSVTPPAGQGAQIVPAVAASLPGWSFDGSTQLTVTNSLPDGSPVSGITFAADAGALVLGGNGVELGGGIVNQSSSTQTVNVSLTLTGNQTIDTAAGNVTIAGNIGQSGGGFGITKTGSQTLILSGTNTYSGGTAVNQGTVVVTNAGAVPSGTSLTVGAGGVFVFDPSQAVAEVGGQGSEVGGQDVTLATTACVTASAVVAGPASGDLVSPTAETMVGLRLPTHDPQARTPGAPNLVPPYVARQVENLSYSQAHDAVLQAFTERPAMDAKAAAALWNWDNSWASGPADRKHDASAVDAVMAMVERM